MDTTDQIPSFVQNPVIFCTQSRAQHPKDPFDSNEKIVHNTSIHLKIDIPQRIALSTSPCGTQFALLFADGNGFLSLLFLNPKNPMDPTDPIDSNNSVVQEVNL
jgi:hypothetical protein